MINARPVERIGDAEEKPRTSNQLNAEEIGDPGFQYRFGVPFSGNAAISCGVGKKALQDLVVSIAKYYNSFVLI